MAPQADPERIAHFRILGRLGQGGMGIVFRAEDERLRRTVALKVLPEAFAQDPERRARFLREARSAAALTHANIATVHDVGEDAGHVYIAMELVEGQSLRERLTGGPLPVPEALRIARGIARGLARAHAKGIVHRDLKPENVMLDAEGEPKILDFGLAKLHEHGEPSTKSAIESGETVQQITREGHLVGTPHYMSPEQAGGGAIDARTDVFSLGVVLYEMCAGARPFEANSVPELLARLLRDPPFPLREVAPDVPAAVVALVERCLAKDPAARFADAGALLAALDGLAASGSLARPVAATVAPQGQGSRLVRVLVLAVGMALVAGVALFVRARVDSPTGAHASQAASASSAPTARAMTDWPPPKTTSAEAAAFYAEALQAQRDARPDIAEAKFESALAADPHLAAAHMRLAWYKQGQFDVLRQHVAAAFEGRSALDARDQRILAYLDESAKTSASSEDRARNAEALATDLPDDPEALSMAGRTLVGNGHVDRGVELLERALKLDPNFALVLSALAQVELQRGDPAATEEAAQHCLAVSPGAASCLETLAKLHAARGECKQLERDADRLVELEPASATPRAYKLVALAANGAPAETLGHMADEVEAVARRDMPENDPQLKVAVLQEKVDLAEWVGDLVAAESHLLAQQSVEAAMPTEHGQRATTQLVDIYLEEGAIAKAAAVGDAYLKRVPTLIHDGDVTGRIYALVALRDAGRLPEARARALLDEWMRELGSKWGWADANQPWRGFVAAVVETPAQAREAIAALPSFGPVPALPFDPNGAGDAGKVYALADDPDRAIPLLTGAVQACMPQLDGTLRDRLRNRLLLGKALEQKGDTQGACEQYAAILERWGNAKPKSVTADAARARSKALGCH